MLDLINIGLSYLHYFLILLCYFEVNISIKATINLVLLKTSFVIFVMNIKAKKNYDPNGIFAKGFLGR